MERIAGDPPPPPSALRWTWSGAVLALAVAAIIVGSCSTPGVTAGEGDEDAALDADEEIELDDEAKTTTWSPSNGSRRPFRRRCAVAVTSQLGTHAEAIAAPTGT